MDEPEQPRKRGRPAGSTTSDRTARIDARVSEEQLAKYKEAGGTPWLVALLDRYTPAKLRSLVKAKD
ncbi:hypothetical protein [Pseudorhodoferax sp. Leaf265]|uniref:hypothetical protein n=1 Tax=Pseudorhodoferax sp. Leaf265 TaxID=1736315 RepID=UPI0012E928B9|nr:hypothetical protein [Pseudorhodoferax sp. Leaf265]